MDSEISSCTDQLGKFFRMNNLDRELIPSNHPLLHEAMPVFNFVQPGIDPVELYNILGHNLLKYNGLGLSANQLGIRARCFVMRAEEIIPVFNPKIVSTSPETVMMKEGCLSFPGMILGIERPRQIKVRFADPKGEMKTVDLIGLSARIFEHELDHLNGITFDSLAKSFALKLAKDRAIKLNKKLNRGHK